jgi:glutathione S-transferase
MLRKQPSEIWVQRCQTQIGGVLAVLEKERAGVATAYWFGERIGHADIAVTCVLGFVADAFPELFDANYQALKAHAAACEAMPVFAEIKQAFNPPKRN